MLRRLRNHAKPAYSSAGAVRPVSMQLRCGFRTGSTWLLHGFNTISTVELVLEPCAEDLLKPSKAAAKSLFSARASSAFFNAASACLQYGLKGVNIPCCVECSGTPSRRRSSRRSSKNCCRPLG